LGEGDLVCGELGTFKGGAVTKVDQAAEQAGAAPERLPTQSASRLEELLPHRWSPAI
jgi:hypothetical protein